MSSAKLALIRFLQANGCKTCYVGRGETEITFDPDSLHNDTLRRTIWDICKVEGWTWYSEDPLTGSITEPPTGVAKQS